MRGGGDRAVREDGGGGWDPEGEAGKEEEEAHEREGDEEEVAPAEGVDCVDCGDGEDPVYQAEAERGGEGGDLREAGFEEDFGRVVGYHVDAAELGMSVWK